MSDYHPLEDPDYYTKRSRSLMQDDYPLEVSRLVFSETDPLLIRWHWHEEVEIEYIVSGSILPAKKKPYWLHRGIWFSLIRMSAILSHQPPKSHVPFILSLSIPLLFWDLDSWNWRRNILRRCSIILR